VTHFIQHYGVAFLFLVVALESSGIPVPGETALIAAGILASRGDLNIVEVIVIAAVAAILGDNIAYWIGRTVGRKLLYRWQWTRRLGERVMPPAERFFARHGGKTVFLARFVAGIRVTAAWMAGITRMHWWTFALWNAAGGICWAVAIGLTAYYAGHAAADAINQYGLWGAGAVVVLAVLLLGGLHLWKRRMLERT